MKKITFISAMLLAGLTAMAQDTYDNARMLGNDLNGTARYVGMGGAMEALGADISTISTNPAGIGMFRRSWAGLSFGAVSQQGVNKFDNLSKTNMSFDQAGFVYSSRTGSNSYLNFAFNYHKGKNYDQILSAAAVMGNSSLNNVVYIKDAVGDYTLERYNGAWLGYYGNELSTAFTQMDEAVANGYTMNDSNNPAYTIEDYAGDNFFDRAHRGWTADYDFNISGNVNNRFYWGLTVGIHDVNYHGYSVYDEAFYDNNGNYQASLALEDERWIDATGADIKAGFIILPIEESPFRVGLSVSTPTWYEVKSENNTNFYNDLKRDGFTNWGNEKYNMNNIYEFKYYTPWKFGLSLGHTINNNIAIGASYEYSDMSSASTRLYNGRFNYYDEEQTDPDREMNNHTEKTLKGVSLLKVGLEFKPDPTLAVRLGYNYQSAMFNENGYKNTSIDSPSNSYVSTADFTNWKATNRITCGLGYKKDHFNVDLAYQYSITNGTFYPFAADAVTFNDGSVVDNPTVPCDVDFKRHQVLLTLGYTF